MLLGNNEYYAKDNNCIAWGSYEENRKLEQVYCLDVYQLSAALVRK